MSRSPDAPWHDLPRESLEAVLAPPGTAVQLPARAYLDPAVLAFERAAIFGRDWLAVARTADLPRAGSFVRGGPDRSLLLVRDASNGLRGFHDVCPHRASSLVRADQGHVVRLACPYHGWTFGLDGRFVGAPRLPDAAAPVAGAPPLARDLQPVRVEAWEGFVFASAAPDGPPLAAHLADVPAALGCFDLAGLHRARRTETVVEANWKLLAENFAESYHFPAVHPALERLTPSRTADSLETRGPWQGGTMDLADGADTVSTDGRLHGRPRIPVRRHEVSPRRIYDFLLFPNLLLSVQPDYLLTYAIWPEAPARSRVVAEILIAAPAGKDVAVEDVLEFWDRVNAEDRDACERQQRAIAAGAWQPGRYSGLEDGTHLFDRMVVSRYLTAA